MRSSCNVNLPTFWTLFWVAKRHKWCDYGDCFEIIFAIKNVLVTRTKAPTWTPFFFKVSQCKVKSSLLNMPFVKSIIKPKSYHFFASHQPLVFLCNSKSVVNSLLEMCVFGDRTGNVWFNEHNEEGRGVRTISTRTSTSGGLLLYSSLYSYIVILSRLFINTSCQILTSWLTFNHE